eukprot:8896914-Pyramimonas_sp.AAC.1
MSSTLRRKVSYRAAGWAGALGKENAGGRLFDLAQAFPRVYHRWIFKVLDRIRLPNKIRGAIKKLYTN